MKHFKISKFGNHSTVSNFVIRKWIEANDLWGSQYFVNKNTKFKKLQCQDQICVIIVMHTITVEGFITMLTKEIKS